MANIISIPITTEIYQEAEKRNNQYLSRLGHLGTHRTDKSRQRMTGYLAEASIIFTFPTIQYSTNDNVDFVLDSSITIDSKAQGCNVKPQDYFSATLYEEQKNRTTDYYIFSRVKNDFSVAWICGIISKKKFFQIAQLKEAGHQTNNFTYDQSRYEVQYKDLKGVGEFITWYNGVTNQKATI
jgi:hypothetical protein